MGFLDRFKKQSAQAGPVSSGTMLQNVVHDAMIDPLTGRGGENEKAYAAEGHFNRIPYARAMAYYTASWFIQNAVDRPARDAVRESITIECKDPEFSRLVINRLDELKAREVLEKLLRYQRINSRGSMILAVAEEDTNLNGDVSHQTKDIGSPRKLCKLNVTEDGDRIHVTVPNRFDITKTNYNEPEIRHYGAVIHPSRYRWIVESFNTELLQGISVVQRVIDAAKVLDSSITSSGRIMANLGNYVVNSDELTNLSPEQRIAWLHLFKRMIDTDGVIAMGNQSQEIVSKIQTTLSGIGEAFDFIQEVSAGSSGVPKAVAFGRAFGVVSAGDFDQLNYAAQVKSEIQEKHLRPVLYWLIDLLCKETQGSVYKYIQSKGGIPDWELEFNDIFKIDPNTEADIRVKHAQADQLDYTMGKATAEELRDLDDRYSELVAPDDPPELTDEELEKEIGSFTDQAFDALRKRRGAA